MGILEAIQSLGLHSCTIENHADRRFVEGFLGSLRPYQGKLREENFHEVMSCLFALKDFVKHPSEGALAASRDVHCLLDRGRALAVKPDGALQSDGLISEDDMAKMEVWLCVISETWMHILGGEDEETIRGPYAEFMGSNGGGG